MSGQPHLSVIIPTYRRPQRALDAVRSALAQEVAFTFEVVVVDNDPARSALPALDLLKDDARLVVVGEPRPGVANARNAGVAAARAGLIAFLDDDEIAPPGWLAELVRVHEKTGADVVFGPVVTRLAMEPDRHGALFREFFAREPRHAEGLIDAAYGCGCSLICRAALPDGAPFAPERNETGGEDDLLFQRMKADGALFAWAPGAWVHETPEPSRVNLAYVLRRAFSYGQGPTQAAWSARPRRRAMVAYWMLVGLGQVVVFGSLAGLSALLRLPDRGRLYRRAAEGLGKLLWFPTFRLRFYGVPGAPGVQAT